MNNLHSISVLCMMFMAAVVVTSCYDTYTGLEYDLSGQDLLDKYTDQRDVREDFLPITIAMCDPSFATISTRSSGAFDSDRDKWQRDSMWENARFHIYAYHKGNETDYTTTRQKDSLECLLEDALAYVPDRTSFIFSLLDAKSEEKINYFYNGKTEMYPYNFFAYYIDDVEPASIIKSRESISVDVTINGTQDIMCGKAKLTALQKAEISKSKDANSIMKSYYSLYSAKKQIIPVVQFEHQLVRLKFEAFPGSGYCENLSVKGVEVLSKDRGTMIVAHNDEQKLGMTFDDHQSWLSLPDTDNSPMLHSDKYFLHWEDSYSNKDVYNRVSIPLGESLLVAPDTRYSILYHLSEYLPIIDQRLDYDAQVEIKLESGFLPGRQYTVRTAVYGRQDIQISTILSGWAKGGEVQFDPEDIFSK